MNPNDDITNFTDELMNRYNDVPEIAPTAIESGDDFQPRYPMPDGIEGDNDHDE